MVVPAQGAGRRVSLALGNAEAAGREARYKREAPASDKTSFVIHWSLSFLFASRNAFASAFRSLSRLLYLLKIYICHLFVAVVAGGWALVRVLCLALVGARGGAALGGFGHVF